MPWTETNYPESLKNLKKVVRNKAIAIANALKDEGASDQKAIAIATDKAKQWYKDRHPKGKDNPFKKKR
ncbi:hypothetical protein YK48G_19010 [Lentilactobacillus fungorum]|uniref:DUF2188 domain-containing protein n=1 Tax=Lentilactobacillus fungorum TaxID=2201250 RepID=A0ABQ3W216_9LACO|nr:hypothetical protein [Lentilactobacillus fungorum]GHP14476.1 hypothetical protein YK48G_19010 [Lentilactobacillus fungorum]